MNISFSWNQSCSKHYLLQLTIYKLKTGISSVEVETLTQNVEKGHFLSLGPIPDFELNFIWGKIAKIISFTTII